MGTIGKWFYVAYLYLKAMTKQLELFIKGNKAAPSLSACSILKFGFSLMPAVPEILDAFVVIF